MKKLNIQSLKSAFSITYLVFIALLCLTMATGFMSVNYMAKYSSTVDSITGTRVAKFDVQMLSVTTAEEITINEDKQPGQELSEKYTFSVSTDSEVAVDYKIIVELDNPLREGMLISMENNEGEAVTYTGDGTESCFEFTGYSFPAAFSEKNHDLVVTVFTASDNTNEAQSGKLRDHYVGNVTVTAVAEQIN